MYAIGLAAVAFTIPSALNHKTYYDHQKSILAIKSASDIDLMSVFLVLVEIREVVPTGHTSTCDLCLDVEGLQSQPTYWW